MLHYNPRQVSISTILVFRRSNYIITLSVIVTLNGCILRRLRAVCSQTAYYTAVYRE